MRVRPRAGVAELADARDSKSRALYGRVGSIPSSGTNLRSRLPTCRELRLASHAKVVEQEVRSSLSATVARMVNATAEEMALDLLREPEFREELRVLMRAAFKRAPADLTADATTKA